MSVQLTNDILLQTPSIWSSEKSDSDMRLRRIHYQISHSKNHFTSPEQLLLSSLTKLSKELLQLPQFSSDQEYSTDD